VNWFLALLEAFVELLMLELWERSPRLTLDSIHDLSFVSSSSIAKLMA
jgi:hypothetical protein